MSARHGVKVKICGVTSVADARLAVELGADYLGLNFYPPSPRSLDVATARRIRDAVAGAVPIVGVFVNRPADEVERIGEEVGVDLFQFHGDETAASIAPFSQRAIKAFRPGADFELETLAPYDECWGLLFDTPGTGMYGGSGKRWNYERVAGLAGTRRVFIAGGIKPGNVREVLASLTLTLGIHGLDVASGVEREPGVKDRALMARLFAEVRNAEVFDGTHETTR